MLPACPKSVAPAAFDPAAARSARLARFKREQLIVDYLNRGVSVAEIAARIGVGEKRMRAIIREILERRMPQPPMEFVAIQTSRLNEALFVAFSAMSPTNLEAVDRVVRIVRELDRYGGAFAEEWARPEASRVEGGEGAPAFGGSLSCSADLALQDDEAMTSSRVPDALAPRERAEGEGLGRLVAAARSAPHPDLLPVNGEKGRDSLENPAQGVEKAEFAPGLPVISGSSPPSTPGRERGFARPENPAEDHDKMEFAPGLGMSSHSPDAASGDPVPTADRLLSLLRDAEGRQGLRACLNRLRDEAAGRERPENPPQDPENVDSAPGHDRLAGASRSGRPYAVRTVIPAPPCMTPVRSIPDGATAR